MKQNLSRYFFLSLLTAAAALAAAFFLWKEGAFLPACSPWSVWTPEKTEETQAAGRQYRLQLKGRRLHVYSAAPDSGLAETWKSPAHLKVQDFLFCDIDSDGGPELLLLCWYIGKPSVWDSGQPVIGNTQWGQHVYIYKPMEDGTMHQHWMASRIMQNIASWQFDDALRLLFTAPDGSVTRWDWFGWGLKYFADGFPEVKFLASGDCLLHQHILEEGQAAGSFDFLFEHISPALKEADLAILGQEGPFVPPRSGYSGYPLFRIPLMVGEAALRAGFNAAACATNHAMDAGLEGIDTTAGFYEEKGVPCLGICSSRKKASDEVPYTLFTKNGIRIALFNYTYGINTGSAEDLPPGTVHLLSDEETVRQELSSARESGDVDACIVLVHWGTEYSGEPDDSQRKWAEVFLDCGVDAVIGSHPHVLQPLEILTTEKDRQMPVFWSLGNLVSRQDQPEQVLGGLAGFTVRLTPDGCELADVRLVLVITHQTKEATTVYLLADYTAELAQEHRLNLQGILPD